MTENILISTKPISVNAMYRGRRFLSKEGKEAKEAITLEVQSQWKKPQITCPVALTIYFYVANSRIDIDNQLKGLLDCMTGTIYKDDSLINELHVYKIKDKENPRTHVEITCHEIYKTKS